MAVVPFTALSGNIVEDTGIKMAVTIDCSEEVKEKFDHIQELRKRAITFTENLKKVQKKNESLYESLDLFRKYTDTCESIIGNLLCRLGEYGEGGEEGGISDAYFLADFKDYSGEVDQWALESYDKAKSLLKALNINKKKRTASKVLGRDQERSQELIAEAETAKRRLIAWCQPTPEEEEEQREYDRKQAEIRARVKSKEEAAKQDKDRPIRRCQWPIISEEEFFKKQEAGEEVYFDTDKAVYRAKPAEK
ncbi:hypothetical protein CYMTET_4182 [Cymbomonas tetramitiformis]|uniref:Uncharacterized protein n=1 Tax=Cymbomonas tetramitiformis TaxID=36881 RepID=A0AAE0H1N9_9CHLO|nr:hypothetical protein CYMTET_4182 [Cymbomonas tetramitiformis]